MQNFNLDRFIGNCGRLPGPNCPSPPFFPPCTDCYWTQAPPHDYPDHWDAIALAAKCRARWCCEHCGHYHSPATGHTLTVHHLDGDKRNCTPENLVALCQRCHLTLQALYRPGQIVMPFALTPWMRRCHVPVLEDTTDAQF